MLKHDTNKLKDYRVRNGYTRSRLAEFLGVDRNYIYMIEAGHRTPSLKVSKKIADVLNTSIEDIFFNRG